MRSSFYFHVGPAAIRVHGGWVGFSSGNRPCRKVRKTVKRALKDARKMERSDPVIETVVTTWP